MNDPSKKSRITFGLVLITMMAASLLDVITLMPGASLLVTGPAWFAFWLIYKMNGIDVGFGKPKRLATLGVGSLLDLIFGPLPAWIAAIAGINLLIYFEEKAGKLPAVGKALSGAINFERSGHGGAMGAGGRRVPQYRPRREPGAAPQTEGLRQPLQDIRPKSSLRKAA